MKFIILLDLFFNFIFYLKIFLSKYSEFLYIFFLVFNYLRRCGIRFYRLVRDV